MVECPWGVRHIRQNTHQSITEQIFTLHTAKKNIREQLCLSEKNDTKSKTNEDLQKKKASCNIKLGFVLKYGSHGYIKQWITTNQWIAMNDKEQVKFVSQIYPV